MWVFVFSLLLSHNFYFVAPEKEEGGGGGRGGEEREEEVGEREKRHVRWMRHVLVTG